MPIGDDGRDGPGSPLDAQIRLILFGISEVQDRLEDAAAWPHDWAERGEIDYLYRIRTILVRDADVERVRAIVPSDSPVEHDKNVRGLTRLEFTDDETRSVEDVCIAVDRVLGQGVATPDHILYVCTTSCCPATEPEEPPVADPPPYPGVSTERCDGAGVRVAVLDSGWLPDAAAQHAWLAGVDGEQEDPIGGLPPRILPYAGHGTFVAGVLRTMAPRADVWVGKTFTKVGAGYESDLVHEVSVALRSGAEVISLDFGTNTRQDIASLGFDVVGEELRNYPGVVLVAAAGNDGVETAVLAGGLPLGGRGGRAQRELAQPGLLHQPRALGGRLCAGRGTGQRLRDRGLPVHRATARGGVAALRRHGALERNVLLRRRWSPGSSRRGCRRPARTARRPPRHC